MFFSTSSHLLFIRSQRLCITFQSQANCAIMFGFRGSYDFLYHSFAKEGGGISLALCVLFYSALNMYGQ